MTPEKEALKNYLDENEVSWADLTPFQQNLLSDSLRAGEEGFTEEQYNLLANRYLKLTFDQYRDINVRLPRGINILAVQDNNGDYLTLAAILTDCFQPGDRYHAVADVLVGVPIVTRTQEDFPVVE